MRCHIFDTFQKIEEALKNFEEAMDNLMTNIVSKGVVTLGNICTTIQSFKVVN
jgi:hypothetical protein